MFECYSKLIDSQYNLSINNNIIASIEMKDNTLVFSLPINLFDNKYLISIIHFLLLPRSSQLHYAVSDRKPFTIGMSEVDKNFILINNMLSKLVKYSRIKVGSEVYYVSAIGSMDLQIHLLDFKPIRKSTILYNLILSKFNIIGGL